MARGQAVAGGADLDGDGFDDLIVSSPGADTSGNMDNGQDLAISELTGAVLFQRADDNSTDQFGWSVAIAGDVDNDGVRDVIIGAPFALNGSNVRTGMARVPSGASGSTLRTFYCFALDDRFGWSVYGSFDSNQDNFGDVIVGAPDGDTTHLGNCGYVSTFSGAYGVLLLRVLGSSDFARLGVSMPALGDLDGDARRDLAAGVPGHNGKGRVIAWSGASVTGSVTTLWSVDGSGAGDELGSALAGQFDANGDGLGDVACGARGENAPGATDAGAKKILSGVNGSVLRSVPGTQAAEFLGACVAGIGDVNNVPGREILAGAPGLDRVLVIDPTSAEVLIELYGQGSTNFGQSVADAGDMDSDGVVDFAVGQPGFDGPALTNHGRVTVYSTSPWVTRYCNSGTSSSGCTPLMSWSGSPRASASSGFLRTASGFEGQKFRSLLLQPRRPPAGSVGRRIWLSMRQGSRPALRCTVPGGQRRFEQRLPRVRLDLLPQRESDGTRWPAECRRTGASPRLVSRSAEPADDAARLRGGVPARALIAPLPQVLRAKGAR